jgi:hypothetical protein
MDDEKADDEAVQDQKVDENGNPAAGDAGADWESEIFKDRDWEWFTTKHFEWVVDVLSDPQPKGVDTGHEMCCTDICRVGRGVEHDCYFERLEEGIKDFTFKVAIPCESQDKDALMKQATEQGWTRVHAFEGSADVDGQWVHGFRIIGLYPHHEE